MQTKTSLSSSFWLITALLLCCSSKAPAQQLELDAPVSVVTLQDDQDNPLSHITSASFSPDGKLLLIVERHSDIGYLYEATTGRLLHTLTFPTELCDSIVAHSPKDGRFTNYYPYDRYKSIPSQVPHQSLVHQVHNGLFTSDTSFVLTGYIDVGGEDTGDHHLVEYVAQITSFVFMDTAANVTRVVPTQYPTDEFQNSDAVTFSNKQHRWYLNQEYWGAHQRGHYDSMMVVASFNDTGADKRTSFPLPKELWNLSVDYGPATPHFAIDSNDNFYASLACLPYIYDETGRIRFTLQLPVSNVGFLRESRVAFLNHEQMTADHVWEKDSFTVLDIGISANRLDVVTAIQQATLESSHYYFLVQEYSLDGELLSQTRIGDKSPLGKPKFFGINSATGKPYLIAQKDDAFKLYELSWK